MHFEQGEKMAVVKAIAETIDLDDQYKVGELMYLDELMNTLDFDAKFMEKAKQLSSETTVQVLQSMTKEKKDALIIMIDKMTESDGAVHQKEKEFLVNLIRILG
jgi:uncharacterized tellurite resistance protein B-like protein